ncbi:hypothetical protein [Pseudomonas sp. N040]|uniref:hypothetical protein n=1 Tax=Pseudomonas sp. N040 TaxID=2785325 RepID=UPI0018A2B394|nr:hypothetical protein [Pseudomonas sp. N040]MBF7729102.1 hypothetical protein [Pseudomonas sp. N040]MBW7012742.1 hypothetical protein [Pseudomonas sp. N040]
MAASSTEVVKNDMPGRHDGDRDEDVQHNMLAEFSDYLHGNGSPGHGALMAAVAA